MNVGNLSVRHSSGFTNISFRPFTEQACLSLPHAFWVFDSNVLKNLTFRPANSLELETSEGMKNLGTVEFICQWLSENGASKESTIIAIGGGVIQDLVTLSSSLFMRGVSWEFIPTTTNAMLDSCVGGKSAINTLSHKNLLGNFYPPEKVHIDLKMLETLNRVDYFGGILEAIKIVFAVRAPQTTSFVSDLSSNKYALTEDMVRTVLSFKTEVVEDDEFDSGRRLLLNYGHTFGHALERATDFRIAHGLAVGVGMLVANELDTKKSYLVMALEKAIFHVLGQLPDYCFPDPRDIDWRAFGRAFESDKKHTKAAYRVVVPENDALQILAVPKSQENLQKLVVLMKKTYSKVLDKR